MNTDAAIKFLEQQSKWCVKRSNDAYINDRDDEAQKFSILSDVYITLAGLISILTVGHDVDDARLLFGKDQPNWTNEEDR